MTETGGEDKKSSAGGTANVPSADFNHTNGLLGGAALRRYMPLYALAVLSIAMVWSGPGGLLIPLHVQQIEAAEFFKGADALVDLQWLNNLKTQVNSGSIAATPEQVRLLGLLARFDAARAANLSIIASIGVFITMLAQPIIGVLSDRTRSRWGRRAPWILGGAIGTALCLVAFWFSNSILTLAVMWSLIGITTNAASAPLAATVADRVPPKKLATASSVAGLGLMLGLVLGTMAAGALYGAYGVAAYLPFALSALLFCALFVIGAPDRPSTDLKVEPISIADYLRSFAVALRDHDFRWVWISKVTIMFGYTISSAFSIYMLQSYIQPALSASEAAKTAPLLLLAAMPGTLIAMIVAGRLSDRSARRKPFVIGSSLMFAVSMIVPLVWPALPALYIQTVLAGIALGAFLTVDQALFIDVLPDQRAAGRDLGIGALGGNLGQALGPIIAGAVVSLTGSYRMVWAVALVVVVGAALAIIPVKRVR